MRFELQLLGTSGAVPAYNRFPTIQLLNIQESLYMIDCGEGAQMRVVDYGLRWHKIRQLFISHLHGDHIYGIPGLISSMGLNRRKAPLAIYGPAGLREMVHAMMPYLSKLSFELKFEEVDPGAHRLVYEDRAVQVFSLPLDHSIPACGYLFREQQRPRSMIGSLIEELQIPYSDIPAIKAGADFTTEDGRVVPNDQLTEAPPRPRSYAYCSDTAYHEPLISMVEKADLLYHEATFTRHHRAQATETRHSTAADAARIARQAGVGQLILGHYSSRYKYLDGLLAEAVEVFPNTLLGMDGGTVSVPYWRAQPSGQLAPLQHSA